MMIAKKILILVVFIVFGQLTLKGQQQYVMTQYMFNNLVLNPAYAGSHESWSFTAMTRYQWVGVDGAPQTQTLSAHGPINSNHASSAGMLVINDSYGAIRLNNFYGTYAYRISFDGGQQHLSLGLQAGASMFRVDLSDANLIDEDDPALDGSDMNSVLPNFGTGVFYHGRKIHAGFSVPFIYNNRLNQLESDLSKQERHYYLTAGADLPLNPNIVFKPGFLVRYVSGVDPLIDLNSSVLLNDIIWLGVTYRVQNSFDFIFELQFTDYLRFGYSYDQINSQLSEVSSGTHELVLNYRLLKKAGKNYNSRSFK